MDYRIAVTSGEERASLAVVRSLSAAGHSVHVFANTGNAMSTRSTACGKSHLAPNPLEDPAAFASQVSRVLRSEGIHFCVPVTDAATTALLESQEEGEETLVPWVSPRGYRGLSDKERVASAASVLGLSVPRGWTLTARAGFSEQVLSGRRFPLVVKPRQSVVRHEEGLSRLSVQLAEDPEELYAVVSRVPNSGFPLLLQERVPGHGLGVFLLVWEGELLAAFAHRRIREKPPSGGVSVLRESIPLPVELREKCRRLLQAFDWNGVAMIEFKGESLEDDPVLMEVNARFWGSLQLAIDAGVDFPRLLVQAAMGEKVEPVLTYRTGVKLRWFWGDVDHLWARLRYSKEELNLPPEAPGRLRAMGDFLRGFGPGVRDEVFRWDDPWPAIHEARHWLLGR